MREFDHNGRLLAKYQAKIFEKSIGECGCSSPIFLRRFKQSQVASKIDLSKSSLLTLEPVVALRLINEEFKENDYGQIKYQADEMFWMGYIYRYICYTRDCSTRFIFNLIPPNELKRMYYVYHTQSEEYVVRSILEIKNLDEDIFDKNKRVKSFLLKLRSFKV